MIIVNKPKQINYKWKKNGKKYGKITLNLQKILILKFKISSRLHKQVNFQ